MIDKDIEILKNLQEELKEDMAFFDYEEVSEAIENVLSELEKKDEIIKKKNKLLKQTQDRCSDILRKLRNRVKEVKKLQQNPNYKALVTKQNKTLEERVKTIKSLKSKLETYKKIAEMLAEECTMFKKIQQIDLDNEYSNGLVFMTKEEVLDWAIKEVANDNKE